MDIRGNYNPDGGVVPNYKQALHHRCKTCGAENTNMLDENIDWRQRCIHAEAAISHLIGSMNDILRAIEMYEGCAMNNVLKQVWKKKVRVAITSLKKKDFRGD